jgi:hypothetical protein
VKRKNVSSRPIQKKHSGRYGDLKLLAISVGLFVACIVGALVIRNKNVHEKATGTPLDMPVMAEQQAFVESPLAESDDGIAAPAYPFQRTTAAPTTPEERKEALNDMADQIPKDQIIVF